MYKSGLGAKLLSTPRASQRNLEGISPMAEGSGTAKLQRRGIVRHRYTVICY